MSTPIQKLFDLTGKTALVTGGSRGLGLQIAEALGEAGAKILLTSRKAADLEEAAAAPAGAGHRHALGGRRREPARRRCSASPTRRMQRLGDIDILVNNAGATWGAPAEDHPLEAWDKVMNLNIRSIFLMSQAVAKASMIPRPSTGASSTSRRSPGWRGSPDMKFIAYGTSKGAVVNFTRTLAGEWGQATASPSTRSRRASSRAA